uniref:Lipid-binding serum glycoprotein N-terminal domain-containing protein n=1 Tax=Podarcis muralis TaxID=64176 RepID=A0A670IE58_PODMU
MRWPKYWSLSFTICPSSEHSGLISFRMERLDLLAVHGTLKSLLQHQNSKASILQPSAFFMVQLSLLTSILGNLSRVGRYSKGHLDQPPQSSNCNKSIPDRWPSEVVSYLKYVLTPLSFPVFRPLNLGRLLHVKLYLDIQVAVRILTDPVSGHVKLVVGNCHNNPGHLRITLLNKLLGQCRILTTQTPCCRCLQRAVGTEPLL